MKDEIKTVSFDDKEYPELLKTIKDAPQKLYFRGELKIEENCVAVVGTRRCSPYGKAVALNIAGDLAVEGITVVSGLAPGIDTVSHRAVVERAKRTIAVLGTGLDEESIYPKENIKLARHIIETGGCLISEYPAGTSGSRFTFPQRNRLISGLCLGTVVVEAKKKSGALITAEWAKIQGREVFAVPGPVHSLNSQGCHLLIKQGAKLVESAEDVLLELNLPCLAPGFKQAEGENQEEELIFEALKNGPQEIDGIIEITRLGPAAVASALTVLEIKGKVRNLGGTVYALTR